MFKKMKQKKYKNEVRYLLGNLRQIELYAKEYDSLDNLRGNIYALEEAINVFRDNYEYGKYSEEDISLFAHQIASMEETMLELKRTYVSIKKVLKNGKQ